MATAAMAWATEQQRVSKEMYKWVEQSCPICETASAKFIGRRGGAGAAAAQTVVLLVDDGSYEANVGFSTGGTAYFVNRLTPPSYPATLRAVQILFPTGQLTAGAQINVVSAP